MTTNPILQLIKIDSNLPVYSVDKIYKILYRLYQEQLLELKLKNERLDELANNEILDDIINERLDKIVDDEISDEENILNKLSEDEVTNKSLSEDEVVYRSLLEDRTASRRLLEMFLIFV
ncbi:25087_t:CDS:2 [Dentiscutata erythropus]|uniref:25087_t:CDS:1 n=1 Tax=Dentiscutata erythropus TaxID=1348616 RepID=A0A9N9BPZ8_9GLOM|nr:25087_t:CDS:2 [Dentiscutata erythropus]